MVNRFKRWYQARRDNIARYRAPLVAQRRCRMLSQGDLVLWAENTLYAVGRSISEARKGSTDPDKALLLMDNALAESKVLFTLVEELHRRATGRPVEGTDPSSLYG